MSWKSGLMRLQDLFSKLGQETTDKGFGFEKDAAKAFRRCSLEATNEVNRIVGPPRNCCGMYWWQNRDLYLVVGHDDTRADDQVVAILRDGSSQLSLYRLQYERIPTDARTVPWPMSDTLFIGTATAAEVWSYMEDLRMRLRAGEYLDNL